MKTILRSIELVVLGPLAVPVWLARRMRTPQEASK